MQRFIIKWRIALESSLAVLVLVGIKLLLERLGWEFIGQNALFTSIIAGGIFLFGLILAGTMSDYKESEKIPAEIASSIRAIWEEGKYTKATYSSFELARLVDTLHDLLVQFRRDLLDTRSRQALASLSRLSGSFLEMDRLGVPANFIVRLKTEEGNIRKSLLRLYYIQRIDFLPSSFILMESIVALVLALLLFTKIEPASDAIVILVFLAFLFIYILRLLHKLDRPFREGEKTMDDVSLFLLHELEDELVKEQAG